jgi:hypothetical protein
MQGAAIVKTASLRYCLPLGSDFISRKEPDATFPSRAGAHRSNSLGRICNVSDRTREPDFPPYGEHFLLTMSSVYPGYHANRGLGDLLVGTAYGALDGGVGGFLIAWIYNRLAS